MSEEQSDSKRWHTDAMDRAHRGFFHQMRGEDDAATIAFREAWQLEERAALCLIARLDFEPSRAILFRSAASLAALAGAPNAARRLAYLGLGGNPPESLRAELEDVLLRVARGPDASGEPPVPIAPELRRRSEAGEAVRQVNVRWSHAA